MSNYYYDEKAAYLAALADVRQKEHDLTPFLIFCLKGITSQSKRVLDEIQIHISRAVFRDLAHELFGRLTSPRKRVIAERQLDILNQLLAVDKMDYHNLMKFNMSKYGNLKKSAQALYRDLQNLHNLGAIQFEKVGEERWDVSVKLEWPKLITETEFFKKLKDQPKARTLSFLH